MQALADMELLRQYVHRNSEEAFAALVSRHVNLVYSAALRKTGNPHAAEEITQAVFIILAKKAGGLRAPVILSGWLHQTARLTAANFLRAEIRRARREQEACMSSLDNEPAPAVWPQILPLLDDALGKLGEKDRNALALRFFEQKSFSEIGAAVGASENAARKRVDYALEKLRRHFSKHGVSSTTHLIAGALSAHSVQAAPAALAQTVTAAALTNGAAAGGSSLILVKTTLLAMKTKTVLATLAAAALVLGTGALLLYQFQKAPPAPPPVVSLPVKFPNNSFGAYGDARFLVDLDAGTRRTPGSPPAGHIKSLVTPGPSGAADYLASLQDGAKELAAYRDAQYTITPGSPLLGKRIRLSGWFKTREVSNWAGATLRVKSADGRIFAEDDMTDRPVHGTTGWREIELVTDVPKEPCVILLLACLYGTGELWCDDFQMDVVPPNTPITDDRQWHVWSTNPNDYTETTDENTTHNGHPAFCLSYEPAGAAPAGSWMWWGQDIRTPEKYRGHTVRMTVWTKTEAVSDHLRPNLRPKGPNFKLLAQDTLAGDRITGTTDWTLRTITCVIPQDTQCLDTGFAFYGGGRVWLDLDSLKYDIVEK